MNVIQKRVDFFSIVLYLALVAVGWLSIYIADIHVDTIGGRHYNQQIWIGISIIVAIAILFVNRQFIVDFAYHYYIILMFVLLLILFAGKEINGAKAWIEIGSFRMQPAEFAKFATSLALAKYMGNQDFNFSNFQHLLFALGLVAIPLSLIVLQNDVGSALVFSSFSIAMYREGFSPIPILLAIIALVITIATIKWGTFAVIFSLFLISLWYAYLFVRKNIKSFIYLVLFPIIIYGGIENLTDLSEEYSLICGFGSYLFLLFIYLMRFSRSAITKESVRGGLFLVGLLAVLVLSLSVSYLFDTLLQPHQKERILQVLGEANESYNIMHSKIAIALGGFSGQGFLQGIHTKLAYVPEQETDFIFTTLGETYGFLGSVFVVLLFVLFILRLIFLAERQTARFSRVYGYSIVGVFIFHFTINIGMVLGLLPVIGIPLPFFSYGGSSLLAFTILLFILLKLDMSREDRVI